MNGFSLTVFDSWLIKAACPVVFKDYSYIFLSPDRGVGTFLYTHSTLHVVLKQWKGPIHNIRWYKSGAFVGPNLSKIYVKNMLEWQTKTYIYSKRLETFFSENTLGRYIRKFDDLYWELGNLFLKQNVWKRRKNGTTVRYHGNDYQWDIYRM